jgi:hypothetical protein
LLVVISPIVRTAEAALSQSSTWKDIGIYDLGPAWLKNWGYEGNGIYGTDGIALDLSTGVPVKNQTVASFVSSYFDLGMLGLSPFSTKLDGGISFPSFFRTLQSDTLIPGRSWSYHAGSYNRKG